MKQYRLHLLICAGTGCVANHSFDIKEKLEKEIEKKELQDEVKVVTTGCQGFCERGPIVIVQPGAIFYQRIKKEDIPHLVTAMYAIALNHKRRWSNLVRSKIVPAIGFT